ncbi:unnamed protein product [Symbiodinium sp. CCMP2456]|nr:unnamed protein product [Symbiodinium sp. CCMP2456]
MHFHRPEGGNDVVARLVKLQCRLVGHETDETLQRDLSWAKSQALRHVPKDVVDAVCKLAELCMQKASLERYAERKQPLVFLYNCTLGRPLHHSQRLSEESRAFVSQVLQPLLEAPERAQGVWKVCLHSAWLEQNMRDWDGAQGGHITGASNGYKAICTTDSSLLMLTSVPAHKMQAFDSNQVGKPCF